MPHDKAWRAKKKAELIDLLGGECVECGTKHNLQFDHLTQRTWQSREIWSNQRIRRYEQEIARGLIVLRCGSCNARKGQPVPREGDGCEGDEIGDGELEGVPF